jgi:Spy/CpxP family protein refolding chaperone
MLQNRRVQNGIRVFTQRGLLVAAFLVAIPLAGSVALQAQNEAPPAGPGHQRGGPERELEHLTRVLSLNADQQTQVKALLTEQRQKMEALRNGGSDADASSQGAPPRREQMESIRNDTDTKITALLNDDQKTKFAQWQAERKARMEHRQGGGPEGAPPPQPNN